MTEADYTAPSETVRLTEEDVHAALAFVVAIEPDPDDEAFDDLGDDAYEAMMRASASKGDEAIRTLRRYALQRQPESLPAMQTAYHGFTNDPRYLESAHISAVVTSSLNQAWNGVGLWQR